MAEYYPEFEEGYKIPPPKCMPPKDPDIESKAISEIMALAIYGSGMKALKEESDIYQETQRVVKLFRDAKLIV